MCLEQPQNKVILQKLLIETISAKGVKRLTMNGPKAYNVKEYV